MNSPSSCPGDGSTIPAGSVTLPYQLWRMIHMYPTDPKPVLRWSDDGLGVVINEVRFRQEAVELYTGIINSNNIGTFKRRLNSYGFRSRRRTHENIAEMWHPFFYRDMDTELLKQVVHVDKTNSGFAWNEGDISEVEDHMEDTTSSDADVVSTIETRNKTRNKTLRNDASTSFNMADGKTKPDNDLENINLPVLEQVVQYDPTKTYSEHPTSVSQSNTINPSTVILNGAALRGCYSANDTNPQHMHIPLDMIVNPPKAEADSSDFDDPVWEPPKKKSSGDDADVEDNPKEEKRARKRNTSPPVSNRKPKTSPGSKPCPKTSSPYKASIDTYYNNKRKRSQKGAILWAEEDRKRQEIERQKRGEVERKKKLERQTEKGISCASSSSTCKIESGPFLHCPNEPLFQSDQCPSASFQPYIQSPSRHQIHIPGQSSSYPIYPQASALQVVLLPFIVTPQGYEPLVMPGGGIQAFPSSIAQLNNKNPLGPTPPTPCCSPWLSSSHSDVQGSSCMASFASPCGAPGGRGNRGKTRGRSPYPTQGRRYNRASNKSNNQTPANKKPTRRKRKRTLYEVDTEEEQGSPKVSAPQNQSLVRSSSNHSLTDQAHMMQVVSKVTKHSP